MARLLYSAICMTLLFAISDGRAVLDVITYSPNDMKPLKYTEHNLPSIQDKEIALSVESCDEVTICFSQVDVNIYQNMFAVTLSTRGFTIKLGHDIQRLEQEYFFPYRIKMCRRRSVFMFSWKENTMRVYKQCSTNIFTRKLPWTGTNYSIRFITVTSKTRARWSYGDVCNGKHFAPPLPPLSENTGSKEFHTSKRTGYLPLTLKGFNTTSPFAFKVKGCGKLALTLHKTRRVSGILTRYEIEIDSRDRFLKASLVKGSGKPFKIQQTIRNIAIPNGRLCSDFRTFRVNYSQNQLEFGGCDGMSERLLHWSSPSLGRYMHMSLFSENHADWSFDVKYHCSSNKGHVTPLLPQPNMACNRGYVLQGSSCVAACTADADCRILPMQRCCRGVCSSKCPRTVPRTAGSVRSECIPTAGSPACTTSAVNRLAENRGADWEKTPNKTAGHVTPVVPYALATGTIDDVMGIEETTMPGPSTSASSSSTNSSSGNSSLVAEQFQDGMEQISKALGSSGVGLASFTVIKLTVLACICAFSTYPV